METITAPAASTDHTVPDMGRFRLATEQYVAFRRDGYVILRGLLQPEDVREMRAYAADILAGRVPPPGMRGKIPGWTPEQMEIHLTRLFMPHHEHPIFERFLLHPRVLDALGGRRAGCPRHDRTGGRDLLPRASLPLERAEPLGGSPAPLARLPLCRRPQLHRVGRDDVARRRDRHLHERRTHPRPWRHTPPVRQAEVRHALRRHRPDAVGIRASILAVSRRPIGGNAATAPSAVPEQCNATDHGAAPPSVCAIVIFYTVH